jgi:hypothetical protein
MQEMGGAPCRQRMIPCPMGSRSSIGTCLDGGFGWGLHEIWSSREGDAANGPKYINEAASRSASLVFFNCRNPSLEWSGALTSA